LSAGGVIALLLRHRRAPALQVPAVLRAPAAVRPLLVPQKARAAVRPLRVPQQARAAHCA